MYDGEGDGHIIQATIGSALVSYVYDQFGRHYSKTVAGQPTTYFLHDDRGNEIAECSLNGSQVVVANECAYDAVHLAPMAVMAGGGVTYN